MIAKSWSLAILSSCLPSLLYGFANCFEMCLDFLCFFVLDFSLVSVPLFCYIFSKTFAFFRGIK